MANNPYRNYKLAGQGTSSCTFAPEHIRLKNTIVQLKNQNTAQKNISRVQELGLPGINGDRNKLLYPYETIEEVPANFPKGNCKLTDDPKNPLKTVKIPYGGKDLSELVVNKEDIYDFFNAFINIFNGLLKLHGKNIAHFDVKSSNMVGEKKDNKYELRLIDFGLSKKTDYSLDTSDFYYYGYKPINYPFWSYDLRLLNTKLFNSICNLTDGALVRDINKFKDEFSKYKYPKILINGITPDLVKDLLEKINDDNKSQILLKSDVFSLGLTLYIIWNRVTGYGLNDNGELTYKGGQANKLQTCDAQIEASEKVFELVKRMCDPDPFRRLTLKDAKNEYELAVLHFIQRAYPRVGEIEPVTPPGSPHPSPPGSSPTTPPELPSTTPPGSPPPTPNKGGSHKLRTRKNKRNNKRYVKPKKKRTTKKH
jgi:serine/threonine protein kinase